jgi:hypothetical protein
MRNRSALFALAAVAACNGSDTANNHTVYMSGNALKARITAMADCPSPLTRLGIGRAQPRIASGQDGVMDFIIPAAEGLDGSILRFRMQQGGGGSAAELRISWSFELYDAATELDLGEDRLLNPAKLAKDLQEAINTYLSHYAQLGTRQGGDQASRHQLAATCRTIGRLIDAVEVTTSPALRSTIQNQKRRDALGWLFRDNYQLRTDSPDWDMDGDYQRPYDY